TKFSKDLFFELFAFMYSYSFWNLSFNNRLAVTSQRAETARAVRLPMCGWQPSCGGHEQVVGSGRPRLSVWNQLFLFTNEPIQTRWDGQVNIRAGVLSSTRNPCGIPRG